MLGRDLLRFHMWNTRFVNFVSVECAVYENNKPVSIPLPCVSACLRQEAGGPPIQPHTTVLV
jgi:hypothetical protein